MCEYFGCVSAGGWNWTAIGAIGTWFVGVVGAVLVAYQLWLQIFARKIRVLSCTAPKDSYHGDGFDVVLLNETLAPKSITKIQIVSNNQYIAMIKEFEEPLILEPYKAVKIIGDRYAEIELGRDSGIGDKYFIVVVDGHKRFIKFKGKINKHNEDRLVPMSDSGVFKYGKEFLGKDVCAVLSYRSDSKDDFTHIFILSNGLMDKMFLGSNIVPKEAMKNLDMLRDYFYKLIDKHQIEVEIGIQGVLKWHNK